MSDLDLWVVLREFGQGFDDVWTQTPIRRVVDEGPFIEIVFPVLFGPFEVLVDLLDGLGGDQLVGGVALEQNSRGR